MPVVAAVFRWRAGGHAQQPRRGRDYFVYAGTYTNPTAKTTSSSKGIYAWRFDSKSGTLAPIGLVAETINPAHVWGTRMADSCTR